MLAHLASVFIRESHEKSVSTNYQQISPYCSRPTRFQIRAIDHLSSAAVNNRYCNVIQPAALDTVYHNNLLSKINISLLPSAKARWLSCYQRERQAQICSRCVKSMSMKLNIGIQQGSKMSYSLFIFYITDMPKPSELINRFAVVMT